MTENNFNTVNATVVATHDTEIWVRYEDGQEAAYPVSDPSFRCREGHQLTAVLYGTNPILLRNDSTHRKIQLHTGEDVVGSGPEVKPFDASNFLGLLMCIACPPVGLFCLIFTTVAAGGWLITDVLRPIKWLIAAKARWVTVLAAGIALFLFRNILPWEALGYAIILIGFGVGIVVMPYFGIIHPRIRRAKHQRLIRATDAIISRLYSQL